MPLKTYKVNWDKCCKWTFTLRKPSNKFSWGKVSQTMPQLLVLVALLHEPMPADILRMAAKEMTFSFNSDGESASLRTLAGSGSLSPWQLSVTSETSRLVSVNTSSSIVSTWLLFDAGNERRVFNNKESSNIKTLKHSSSKITMSKFAHVKLGVLLNENQNNHTGTKSKSKLKAL